jgi:hypothetical protein
MGGFDEADLVEDEVPGVGDAVDEHEANVAASIITLNPTTSFEPCRRGTEQRWTEFTKVLPLLPVASEPRTMASRSIVVVIRATDPASMASEDDPPSAMLASQKTAGDRLSSEGKTVYRRPTRYVAARVPATLFDPDKEERVERRRSRLVNIGSL